MARTVAALFDRSGAGRSKSSRAVAPRAFLPGAKGSGALSLRLLAPFALTIAALVGPAAAQAEIPTLVPDGQFESQQALGVAVDNSASESRGDVYVTGFLGASTEGLLRAHVNKFDGLGNLLSPPSPIGETFAYGGAAVSPANGDVYAFQILSTGFSFEPVIDTYDPASGELLGSFAVEPSNNFLVNGVEISVTVVGIAADSAGNVYVPVTPKNEVLEYNPATCPAVPEPCVPLKTFTGGAGAGALKGPTGVAVDAAGNLWVADTGNNRIEELSPADTPLDEIASEGVGSVALDAHGDVFAIVSNSADFCGQLKPPCSHLVEYSATGLQVADLGAGLIGAKAKTRAHIGEPIPPDMVAVSDATGRVYVTEVLPPEAGPGGRVFKFRPPVAPTLEGETATEVGVSGAKLGAVVNPGGVSAAYRFEYGTTSAYGSSVPFPEGDTGAGFTSRTVWAGVSDLAPGTTYHYRVVVTGALGEPLRGKDQTFTTATTAQGACQNEQLRTGFSASLPDCRAYELVTPPNKGSAQPDKNQGGNGPGELQLAKILEDNFAAPDGNRLSFIAEDVLPGSPSALKSYVATRGPGGWSEENVDPPTNYYGYECPQGVSVGNNYSEDLSKAIIAFANGGQCGIEPELVAGEPRDTANLFVRDNATGTYQLVNLTPPGVTPADAHFLAASRDFSHVVFGEEAQLTPEALPGIENLYEWSAGQVRLLTLLPDETPVTGSLVDISADGSHVFFKSGGNLYVRVNGSETLQLDASQASGPGGGGHYLAASHDGSVALVTDDASAALTADTVPGSGTNLYLYDSTAPAGQRLTDLTPVANAGTPGLAGLSTDGSQIVFTDDASAALTADTVPGSGTNLYRYNAGAPAGERLRDLTPGPEADVQGALGVSEDGSSVYFKATGVLTGEPNQHGETAHAGDPNVYISRAGGAPTFIANVPGAEGTSSGHLKVSRNGLFFAWESVRKLTAYDNVNPSTGQPALEAYLYDAATNTLACASCNPSGAPPTAGGAGVGYERSFELSENGQVFFDSSEGLLPADTNGKGGCSLASGLPACTDVYEFEPDGAGSCAQPAGCLSLISTGTGALETFFIDASPSGNDVFIREYQKLVPRDTQDEAPSLYDVRVNGGFPEPGPPPPCTTADSCRPAAQPQPSISGAPSSATFSGPGNAKPKPKKHHKKKHRAEHRRSHKRANTNRGGHK